MSGKLIDRFGVKAVLAFGLAASAAGALFLALVATQFANMATLIISSWPSASGWASRLERRSTT